MRREAVLNGVGLSAELGEKIERLRENIGRVILGKDEAIRLCVTGLLAQGHILIEDVPGMGKTTLAQALARSIDCDFSRIQFTSDMLPSDILGVSILDPKSREFEFRPGPIFSGVVLADEVNRTPPKTQSALLEAMSEFHISMDGVTYPLPEPFIVLATQNPIEYEGTYTLPESQLDRFMLRIEVGYPDRDSELLIMKRRDPLGTLDELKPVLSAQDVRELQEVAKDVAVEASVVDYMLDIVQATRTNEHIQLGVSPRGAQSLCHVCKARALVEGRDFVTPDDVKYMTVPSLSHRIIIKAHGGDLAAAARARAELVADVTRSIPIPV